MLSDNAKSYLHLHFIVFIWGFTAIMGALITLDALPLVWFRMIIGAAVIGLYAVAVKVKIKVPRKLLIQFLAAGIIIALHWFTFFKAIKLSNVSTTLACLSTGAFFTSLLEWIFYRKKIIYYEIFFGLIVVASLCIIFYQQDPYFFTALLSIFKGENYAVEGAANYPLGVLTALLSASLSALFAIINGNFAKQHDAVTVSFYELLGGIGFFALCLLFTGSFNRDFFIISGSDWLWLFILGTICTGYAAVASVKIMKFLSPYTVMLTINLEPIYGIILAVIVFNDQEKMSISFYIGAAVIITTVIINGILKNKRKIEN